MGEGAALEDDETTRRRDDEQSGLASAKRLEARSCRLVSPSSRRPVVVGPESGAGFPARRTGAHAALESGLVSQKKVQRVDAADAVAVGRKVFVEREEGFGENSSRSRRSCQWKC